MDRSETASDAYDRFASFYDEWTAQNDYEMWLGAVLLPALDQHGLQKGWALDVGCGTGRAFEPLLARGWRVVGCDVSPGMLAKAGQKFGSRVQLLTANAVDLPLIAPAPEVPATEGFQLILLLNDVVNYLVADGDLERLFAGIKGNLNGDRGRVVFDANTLALFRADYAAGVRETIGNHHWRGLAGEVGPGGVFEGELIGSDIEAHTHRQRHWPIDCVQAALEATGLRCLATLGQREEGGRVLLSESPSEERDAKVVYIAAHAT